MFLQLRRPKHKWPPTETKVSTDRFFFRYGRERSSSDRRPKFFCAWHDRKFLRLAPVEAQVSANRLFVVTGSKEAHVTADGIILGTGANEAKMTADGNFCAWRDRKFLCLARPRQNIPLAAFFCNWGDRKFFEQSSPPTKNFCVWRDRKLFDWRDRSIGFRREKSICDWRDRSTIDSLPHFFCNWGDCSTNERGPKCFRDWRVRKFLRQARPT